MAESSLCNSEAMLKVKIEQTDVKTEGSESDCSGQG